MIHKIYSVRDIQVEAFLQPFFSPTMGSAIRSLTEAANDPQHSFSKHAPDYHLYALGEFDDATGMLIPIDPTRVISISELIVKK